MKRPIPFKSLRACCAAVFVIATAVGAGDAWAGAQLLPLQDVLGMTAGDAPGTSGFAAHSATNGIFDPPKVTLIVKRGDAYGADPLVQTDSQGYYLDAAPMQPHIFYGVDNTVAPYQSLGFDILSDNPSDDFFALDSAETQQSDGTILVGVRISCLTQDTDQLQELITASVEGNGLTSWRMDVGTGAADNDALDLMSPVDVIGARMFMLTTTNQFFGQTALGANASTSTSLAGAASMGNGQADPDISGANVSQMIMEWTVLPVPEPTSLSLLAVPALALRRTRRRRMTTNG